MDKGNGTAALLQRGEERVSLSRVRAYSYLRGGMTYRMPEADGESRKRGIIKMDLWELPPIGPMYVDSADGLAERRAWLPEQYAQQTFFRYAFSFLMSRYNKATRGRAMSLLEFDCLICRKSLVTVWHRLYAIVILSFLNRLLADTEYPRKRPPAPRVDERGSLAPYGAFVRCGFDIGNR